jgi:hypothetical protein
MNASTWEITLMGDENGTLFANFQVAGGSAQFKQADEEGIVTWQVTGRTLTLVEDDDDSRIHVEVTLANDGRSLTGTFELTPDDPDEPVRRSSIRGLPHACGNPGSLAGLWEFQVFQDCDPLPVATVETLMTTDLCLLVATDGDRASREIDLRGALIDDDEWQGSMSFVPACDVSDSNPRGADFQGRFSGDSFQGEWLEKDDSGGTESGGMMLEGRIEGRFLGSPTLVTVQVLRFDEDGTGPGTPAVGASVTLQGVGGEPRFGSTSTSGVASFSNAPRGPYTATAQVDIVSPDANRRLGATVVGADPADPKTIVLPIFDAQEEVMADVAMGVSVFNSPPDTSYFDFQVSASSDGRRFYDRVSDLSFLRMPSGVPLNIACSAYAGQSLDDLAVVAVVILRGLVAVPDAQVEFDFGGADACSFDRTVAVSYGNVPPGGFDVGAGSAEFVLRGGGGDLVFGSPSGPQRLPATIRLPDLACSALSGFDGTLEFSVQDLGGVTARSTVCEIPLGDATPTLVSPVFLGLPTTQSPTEFDFFPTFGPGNTVQWLPGSDNGTATGLNRVSLAGTVEVEDINGDPILLESEWQLYLPASQTSLVLPPLAPGKAMFGCCEAEVRVSTLRFPLSGFDYATLFGPDFASSLATIQSSPVCSADSSLSISIGSGLLGATNERGIEPTRDRVPRDAWTR